MNERTVLTQQQFNNLVEEWKQFQLLEEEAKKKRQVLEPLIKMYMDAIPDEEVFTPTSKVSYKIQERENFNKALAQADGVDLAKYTKKTAYKVLRIK